MPNLTSLTLDQLRAATKAQIISAIGSHLAASYSKRQLIAWLLDRDVIADAPKYVYRPDGQIELQTEVERDAETGARVGGKVTTWSYFETGEVDTITVSQRDATGQETGRRTIRHYRDGRGPVVEVGNR